MQTLGKNQVDRRMRDVRPADTANSVLQKIVIRRMPAARRKFLFYGILITSYIGALLLVGYSLRVWRVIASARTYAEYLPRETLQLKQAALRLDAQRVTQSLASINSIVTALNQDMDEIGLTKLIAFASRLSPNLAAGPKLLEQAQVLGAAAHTTSASLAYLKREAFSLMNSGQGASVASALHVLQDSLAQLVEASTNIRVQSSLLATLAPRAADVNTALDREASEALVRIYQTQSFLEAAIPLLESGEDHHFLILFQNPTEIRPAGGFIGSFGYLTLRHGSIASIVTDDIYNADRQLDQRIIPPRELQRITPDWEARDANWFADFPASAKKVSAFLEASQLFADQKISFDGTIAINTNVLKTLLHVTGPIAIPEYGLTLDENNFLPILQREVESGRDKKPGQNPKKILSFLMPLVMEQLHNASDSQLSDLIERFRAHLEAKDIMIAFNDEKLAGLARTFHIDGGVWPVPEHFSGDYLSVINANIAAGKTDAVITQSITVESAITASGDVHDTLTIQRSHTGGQESDWWYNVTNKNLAKILVPARTTLQSITGNSEPLTKSPIDYTARGYHPDADLAAVETQDHYFPALQSWIGQEFGRTSFSTRFDTPAGASRTMTLSYQRHLSSILRADDMYQFVFEKQSGASTTLRYSVTAPPGFIWKENNAPQFIFETNQPRGREIIELHLARPAIPEADQQ